VKAACVKVACEKVCVCERERGRERKGGREGGRGGGESHFSLRPQVPSYQPFSLAPLPSLLGVVMEGDGTPSRSERQQLTSTLLSRLLGTSMPPPSASSSSSSSTSDVKGLTLASMRECENYVHIFSHIKWVLLVVD
jgi:hypothetical protein